MSESARSRLARLTEALIAKIARWEAAAAETEGLEEGIALMRAQAAYAASVLKSDSPIGIVRMMGEIDECHTDLGC